MDLLVISPTPTSPRNSGNRKRIHSLLTALKGHGINIHFRLIDMFGKTSIIDPKAAEEMNRDWHSFESFSADRRTQTAMCKIRCKILRSSIYARLALAGIRIPLEHDVDDWCTDNLLAYTKRQFAIRHFDAILVNYVFLSGVLQVTPPSTLKVIDTHDIFANRHQRLNKSGVRPSFFTTTAREENRGLTRANLVIAIQEIEGRELANRLLNATEVMTVSHLEPKAYLDYKSARVAIVGLLGSENGINITSTQRFCDELTRHPELSSVRFLIGGSVSRKLKRLPPNVECLGHIESLPDFYGKIDLFINPMITGTGLKIKTVEAMSFGCPVLSTDCGTEGIETGHFYHQFDNLKTLVQHLEDIIAHRVGIEDYAAASRNCYDHYANAVNQQTEILANILLTRSKQ